MKTVLAGPDTDGLLAEIRPGVSLVVVETMSNPLLRVVDLKELARGCAEAGARLLVDNTFTTPLLCNPIADGAWGSVHSVTKYLAGHNDVVGGALALDEGGDVTELWDSRRRLGTIMGPFEAYLSLRGASTLRVRFEAQCRSAQSLAEYLADHPRVSSVHYPGLPDSEYHALAARLFTGGLYGGVVSFKVKGGRERALSALKRVKVIKPSPSLGGVESLLTYPLLSGSKNMSPSIREELGIGEDLLRLAVGLEDVEDLKADIAQALK